MASGNEVVTRIISIPVNWSRAVDNGVFDTSNYSHIVRMGGGSNPSYVALESVLSSNDRTLMFNTSDITVTRVELEFWHREADLNTPVKNIEVVQINNQPSTRTNVQLSADISGATAYLSQEIHSIRKTKETVVLGSSSTDQICQDFTSRLINPSPWWLAIGIRRQAYVGSEDIMGDVDIGGVNLSADSGTEWRDKDDTNNNIGAPPKFIVTWETTINATDIGRTETRYTTIDPTTVQNTPNSSIGGFVSSNEIYSGEQINQFVNSTQTTISLESSSIPETSGLAQLGAEIFKYGSVSGENLLNITRGVSPGYSFPSGLLPFSAYCYFLEIDKLFNTRPTANLSQCRCVSIVNTGFDVKNVQIILRQNSNSIVRVDVGIEVPVYNRRSAVLLSNVIADTVLSSQSTSVTEFRGDKLPSSSSLFSGGYLTIGSTVAEILSFATDAGTPATATFVIDQSVTANAGDTITIHSAPSQRLLSDSEEPTENSGRFFGFISNGGSIELSHNSIRENNNTLFRNEDFYVWIKRTVVSNSNRKENTGAILVIKFDPI